MSIGQWQASTEFNPKKFFMFPNHSAPDLLISLKTYMESKFLNHSWISHSKLTKTCNLQETMNAPIIWNHKFLTRRPHNWGFRQSMGEAMAVLPSTSMPFLTMKQNVNEVLDKFSESKSTVRPKCLSCRRILKTFFYRTCYSLKTVHCRTNRVFLKFL